jgi:hypothetical protein
MPRARVVAGGAGRLEARCEAVPNRKSAPRHPAARKYTARAPHGRKRTLCNHSDRPTADVAGLRGCSKGAPSLPISEVPTAQTRDRC